MAWLFEKVEVVAVVVEVDEELEELEVVVLVVLDEVVVGGMDELVVVTTTLR